MRWLKKIIITLFALQIMFAPDVCLMLCCHAPSAIIAEDESHLPPCHRKQAQRDKTATNTTTVHIAFHAPCSHSHDAQPAVWQRGKDESSLSLLSAAMVAAPLAWQANGRTHVNHLPSIQSTASPPFRERNLPLRI